MCIRDRGGDGSYIDDVNKFRLAANCVPIVCDEDGVPTAKVTLMTLHSAKGLEFPYVFMTGMELSLIHI